MSIHMFVFFLWGWGGGVGGKKNINTFFCLKSTYLDLCVYSHFMGEIKCPCFNTVTTYVSVSSPTKIIKKILFILSPHGFFLLCVKAVEDLLKILMIILG